MIGRIQKLKNKKGFTLVELIVVIAIIAILTAVIVPLVGRYSAQATYTTLQDSAKTVSNETNNVISAVTMMGSVFKPGVPITGKKVDGVLTVTIPLSTPVYATKAGIHSSVGTDGKGSGAASAASTVDQEVAVKLAEGLQDAIPDGATFFVLVSTNTVEAVVYSNNSTLDVTTIGTASAKALVVQANTDFESAYELKSAFGGDTGPKAGTAVGVAGSAIPGSGTGSYVTISTDNGAVAGTTTT